MPSPRFYRPENLYRSRYIYAAVIVAAIAVFVYSLTCVVLDSQRLRKSRIALSSVKRDRVQLQNQSMDLQQALSTASATGTGGLVAFAVRISGWAEAHGIKLESLAPQGDEKVNDIKVSGFQVGRWSARIVQLQGRGDLQQVMLLIDQLKMPSVMPVELNKFSLRSLDDGKSGKVLFQFKLTVYESKSGVGA